MTHSLRRAVPSLALALAFVLAVQYFVGWREVLRAWSEVPVPLTAAAVLLITASYGCRAARLSAYFRGPTRVRFGPALRVTLVHNLLNHVMPFRTGEASFPILLKRAVDLDVGRGLATLVWFRLLDAAVLASLGGALIAFGHWRGAYWFALLAIGPALPFASFALRPRIAAWVGALERPRLKRTLQAMVEAIPSSAASMVLDVVWTILNWLFKLFALAVVLAVFSKAGPVASLVAVLSGELTSLLPLHAPAGLGTYEAGIVSALALAGTPTVLAIKAAVNVHLMLLTTAMILGFAALAMHGSREHRGG
jgi:uncharacterized membrane protein YbhN (UPF0104 family)